MESRPVGSSAAAGGASDANCLDRYVPDWPARQIHRPCANVMRLAAVTNRALLSLSAYQFQRGYWFGGVLLVAALVLSNPALIPETSWIVSIVVQRWVVYVAIGALLLAPLCTALSEAAFYYRLTRGVVVPDVGFFPTTLDKTETPTAQSGPLPTGPQVSRRRRFLIPIPVETGGIKQIAKCFVTNTFKSHVFGYSPYSMHFAPLGEEKPRPGDLQEIRREVVLATEKDSVDFESFGKFFEFIRVCDGCWILKRTTK